MSDETKAAKPKKHYIVHTVGGESLTIPAYDTFFNDNEDRIYFLDENGQSIEKWIVYWSKVAAIEITDPPTVKTGQLRM
jgi:hypothetical protein